MLVASAPYLLGCARAIKQSLALAADKRAYLEMGWDTRVGEIQVS